MLHCDRYLGHGSRIIDLATSQRVYLKRSPSDCRRPILFARRGGLTLIDFDAIGERSLDVWERWAPGHRPRGLAIFVRDFIEMLECASLGEPRAFTLDSGSAASYDYLVRTLAREARVRGWIPIAVQRLAALGGGSATNRPWWLRNRSLAVFVGSAALRDREALTLTELSRHDSRPHVLVRLVGAERRVSRNSARVPAVERTDTLAPLDRPAGPHDEARARWAMLLGDGDAAVGLASVLVARDRPFEARAVLAAVPPRATDHARASALVSAMNHRAVVSAAHSLSSASHVKGGWEMVDDFVGVLRLCQDTEDEQMTLARVGAFLRERLQASSVAFVARDGAAPRVLARVGSDVAGIDLAVRSMETGAAIAPSRKEGPVESASPVRHAAEIIGAVWCRWSAGTPVATEQATTLLGIAAAATAPSMHLAVAKSQPATSRGNPVPELVGDSGAMVAVRDAIVRAAASPFPVVIEGESGSGKELAARAIHSRSARRDKRFCAINCAALVDDLVESELFGHLRGAFTGAISDRPGMFEEASGGTIFLDEVAELGVRVQAKLLRTLQEGEIRRVGDCSIRRVDVRVVAATNRPLAREVSVGRFRTDLWYRLDVVRITLPPLRERLEDLPGLVAHLWQALAARTASRTRLSATAVAALARYDWPGNIRELQNVLASMMVATPRAMLIGPSALPAHVARAAALDASPTLADARRQFEERYIRAALARAGGRTSTAARDLGLSRQGLSKLMGRLGIAEVAREPGASPNVQLAPWSAT